MANRAEDAAMLIDHAAIGMRAYEHTVKDRRQELEGILERLKAAQSITEK